MPYINPGRSPVIVSDEGDLLEAGQVGDLSANTPRVKALAEAGFLIKIDAPSKAKPKAVDSPKEG